MIGSLPERARDFLHSEFFRYFVSGGCAFACDFAILVIGTEVFGFHYLISNIGGYATGLLVSYYLNVNWVFRYRRFAETQVREFIFFTLIVITGLALSEIILFTITEYVEVHYTVSKVVATFFVFLFNFITKKWLLFS